MAVIAVSAGVYLNTLWNGFVFDDDTQLLHNPWIRDIGYIPVIFKSNVWAFAGGITNYYRPVMYLLYMLSYKLFGIAPWGFHLINILLNTAVSLLAFVVTARVLKDYGVEQDGASSVPFFTAVIFAVHPIHTEAVAWVAGVPDLSYALFYLLSLYFYMVSRSGGPSARLSALISVALFFVAMLCKEPAVTLPAVLFGYDYVVKKCKDGPFVYLKRYMPYAIALAVYLSVRVAVLGGFSPKPPIWKFNPYQIAVNVPPLFGQYIVKLLLPMNLNIVHPFQPVASLLAPAALLGTVISAGFLTALVISFKKRSIYAMGLALFAVPLLPSLYIPGLGRNVFCERYLYLPVFGSALLAGILYARIATRMPSSRKPIGVFVAALITVYSAETIIGNRVWADNIALWSHSLRVRPDNPFAHGPLGEAYYRKGLVDKAIDEYKAAIRLNSEIISAHVELGEAYVKKGVLDEALKESRFAFSQPLGDKYVFALAHCNIGTVYAMKGQLKEAEVELDKAIINDPLFAEAHNVLGDVYKKEGRIDEAMEELEKAVKLNPKLPDAHSSLGIIYGMRGDMEHALEHCRLAVEQEPDSPMFHDNLGIVYSVMGWNKEAREQFALVLKIDPTNPKAHNNLGMTYAKMGHTDMAIREFEEGLKLDPDNAFLLENLRRARESGSPAPRQGR